MTKSLAPRAPLVQRVPALTEQWSNFVVQPESPERDFAAEARERARLSVGLGQKHAHKPKQTKSFVVIHKRKKRRLP